MTAKTTFELAIQDAIDLVDLFDSLNKQEPPDRKEVLKRASLIMALTAWETYVEDRIMEAVDAKSARGPETFERQFLTRRLHTELKKFHTPNTERTKRLFLDFLGTDITDQWKWNPYDIAGVCTELDELVKKRGEAAHRARGSVAAAPSPHLIKIAELRKAIGFLRKLVDATERALG